LAILLFIFGTRPEAIKLCPVIRHLRAAGRHTVRVCITAQHRAMLDQVLDRFGVRPDHDLDLMRPGQTLSGLAAAILAGLDPLLAAAPVDLAIVQGDTTTTMAAALAAFHRRLPVAHVEAGLRTGNLDHPFPEEMNRVLTARLAALHFAPTEGARHNLLREGVPDDRIAVTGNPGIDAVLQIASELEAAGVPQTGDPRKLIVVTAHRRESFGPGLERICDAISRLAARGGVRIVYPVHRNPNVLEPVTARLEACPGVDLVEPLDYFSFVGLMRRAHLILTDSGGIQEEAPSLGKPVLVMRENTERPAAVEAGTVKLVGTDPARIVAEAVRLLEDEAEYRRMSQVHNPYGDGRASPRIAAAIDAFLARNRLL
jgi:UDP-N-acetylglucosamine 2-epimerase (non-hydrolysing)